MSFGNVFGSPQDSYGYQQPQRFRTGLGVRFLPILIGLVIAAVTMLRGCETGPFGRKQMRGLDASQEAALGAQAFRQVMEQSRVVPPGQLTEAVTRITKRLITATRAPEFLAATQLKEEKFDWGLQVVESREQNAFCLPGGKMVVYTGILPTSETEQGLSVVIGHEIAHALAHHGAERMGQNKIFNIGKLAVAGSVSGMDPTSQRALFSIFNMGAQFGVMLPYNRTHETEADHIGILMMAVAGYDPKEAPMFWKRMSGGTKGSMPEFASTHPNHETRIRDLDAWMDDAMKLYRQFPPAPNAKAALPTSNARSGGSGDF